MASSAQQVVNNASAGSTAPGNPAAWNTFAESSRDIVVVSLPEPKNNAAAGKCDCGRVTNEKKKCLSCTRNICAECNQCILQHCHLQTFSLPTVNNPRPFQRHESVNARRILASCGNPLCGDGLPVSMLGGTSVTGDKCKCSEILIDRNHTYRRGERDAVCRMGHHCLECRDVIMATLLEANYIERKFTDERTGEVEVLREYACGCFSQADFSLGALCKLCNRPCKPLTLNDPSSRYISQVHNGEEGMGQVEPCEATATTPARSGTVGWSGADTFFYLN